MERYNIRVVLSGTNKQVPFTEVFEATREAFLRLVRNNIPKDAQDQFSYGTIYGGQMVKSAAGYNVLSFTEGGFWNFSTINKDLMFNVYEGIARNESEFAFGMYIDGADTLNTHYVDGANYVLCRPGVLLRKFDAEGTESQLTVLNDGLTFFEELQRHTHDRIKQVAPNINADDLTIRPVEAITYRMKSAAIGGQTFLYNEGVLRIEGSKEVLELLSCIGLGDMIHSGFGHLSLIHPAKVEQWKETRSSYGNRDIRLLNGEFVKAQTVANDDQY